MEPIQLLENLISVGRLSEALDFLETLSQKERQCWQIQNLTGIVCACCGQPQERPSARARPFAPPCVDAVRRYRALSSHHRCMFDNDPAFSVPCGSSSALHRYQQDCIRSPNPVAAAPRRPQKMYVPLGAGRSKRTQCLSDFENTWRSKRAGAC